MLINAIDYGDNWISPDELDWSPIAQATEHSLTGALLVEEHTRQAGRPITLTGNWLTRSQVEALAALRDVGGSVYLSWRGITRAVYWNHKSGAITAREVFDTADPATDSWYEITLRFVEG